MCQFFGHLNILKKYSAINDTDMETYRAEHETFYLLKTASFNIFFNLHVMHFKLTPLFISLCFNVFLFFFVYFHLLAVCDTLYCVGSCFSVLKLQQQQKDEVRIFPPTKVVF